MAKFIIGITGGIASGKTVVSDTIKALGGCVVDTDLIAREVVEPGTKGARLLKNAFPSAFDGEVLDRAKLRSEALSDPQRLKTLNAITHPLIEKEVEKRIKAAEGNVYLVVPLMFETGYDKKCDYILTVVAPESERIKRLKMRNNTVTDEQAKAFLDAQTSDGERIRRSDEVLNNDGDVRKAEACAREFYYRMENGK